MIVFVFSTVEVIPSDADTYNHRLLQTDKDLVKRAKARSPLPPPPPPLPHSRMFKLILSVITDVG